MPCPPLVPISVIPPVSQGVGPLVYANGSQVARLNTPLNPSWLVYDGSVTRWSDGSSGSPINLANIQQVPSSTISYLLGINGSGDMVSSFSGAKWVEIDVCVDGTPMKMMVIGTDPY